MEVASLKLRMNSLAPGREELESRLRELTENLIQKQTALNTLNSEKSSLNIQLQRLQVPILPWYWGLSKGFCMQCRVN